jgi:thymidylate synthase
MQAVIPHYEDQYLELCRRIRDYGKWVVNDRTGKRIKAVIGHTFMFDVGNDPYPVITTRPAPTLMPRAEILGYLKGLSNAADFAELGAKTWFKNANETKAWVANPNRKGENDCGRIYGVQGRSWRKPDGTEIDQFAKLIHNLQNGIDDRGEILSFYNAGEFDMGCLRPCMHTHQFNLLGDELYLESFQRSADVPLGTPFFCYN